MVVKGRPTTTAIAITPAAISLSRRPAYTGDFLVSKPGNSRRCAGVPQHSPMNKLRLFAVIAFLLGSFLSTTASAVNDTESPTCKIKAFYTQPGPTGTGTTKFTFIVEAFDNVAVKRLQYRAAVSGGGLGSFRNYPYVPGTRITFTVACTAFQVQFRSVDTAGNTSAIVSQAFTAPFPKRPIPTPEAAYSKEQTLTVPAQGEVKDVATADVNGDGYGDVAVADFDAKMVQVRLGSINGLSDSPQELVFSEGPQDVAFGRIFGPNNSAANDARPDMAIAVGTKVRILINNGVDGSGVGFSSSSVVPFLLPDSTFFYCVAVRDLNGDGFDDIVAGGVYGFPTVGTVDIYLNKGAVSDGMGGFVHGGFHPPVEVHTGLRIENVLTADIDDDGDADIVAADVGGKALITMLNNGDGTFAAPVTQAVTLKPEAIAVGDITNDGYVDIACFGYDFTGSSTIAGFQLLRNTADAGANYGTFANVGVFPLITIPINNPNVFVPGDIAIGDVTLDGIPEVLICNNPGNSIDIYRYAVIRDEDGEFVNLALEGIDKLKDLPNPLKFAVGRINKDSKPDIVVGNYSTDQVTYFRNNKATTGKVQPLGLAIELTSAADPGAGVTIIEDTVSAELTYSNDGFDDEQGTVLTASVPKGFNVIFTDGTNGPADGIDDVYGFTSAVQRNGTTLLTWTIGDIPIGENGKRRFEIRVPTETPMKKKLTVTGLVKSSDNKRSARSNKLTVATTVSITATTTQMTVFPGGIAEFKLKVKNHAGYAALNVAVTAPVPANCGLRTTAGYAPGFIDTNGDLIARINPTTGRTVVPPNIPPFLHLDEDGDPDVDNPAWPADRRSLSWYIGTMTPGEEVLLRFYAKLAYDFEATGAAPLVLGETSGTQKVTGGGASGAGRLIQIGSAPQINVVPRSAAVGEPSLLLTLEPKACGEAESKSFVTVTTSGRAFVPDVEPPLRTNQIRYQLLFGNLGTEIAESLRLYVLIPEGTSVRDKRGVYIEGVEQPRSQVNFQRLSRTEVGLATGEIANFQSGNFLVLDVPFLERNFPFNPNSYHTVTFTVTLDSSVALHDTLSCFAVLRSDELVRSTLSGPNVAVAHVVEPVQILRVHASREPSTTKNTGDPFKTAALFRNAGGIVATGVEAVFDEGPGSTFVSAFIFDADGNQTPVTTTPLGGGKFRYQHGTLGIGADGFLRIGANFTANHATTSTNRSDPLAFSCESAIRVTDAAERAAEQSSRERGAPAVNPLAVFRNVDFVTRAAPPATAPRFLLLQKAPRVVTPEGLMTYTLIWANISDVWGPFPGATFVRFKVPRGTTYVSSTPTVSLETSGLGYTNGNVASLFGDEVSWGTLNFSANDVIVTTPHPHQAVIATVTVRVNQGITSGTVISDGFYIDSADAGTFYSWPVKTVVAAPGASPDQLRNDLLSALVGASREEAQKSEVFQNDLTTWLANRGAVIASGGAAAIHLDAGFIFPIGGGNIVAAGGGNIVAAGGGNIVAGGGGNIVAAGGGNIVAAGGGNVVSTDGAGIVAAGGGNLLAISGLSIPNLNQANLYRLIGTIKYQATGELIPNFTIAQIVAGGGGNIVAAGGGNLIGGDGASIVNNDIGSFITDAQLQSAVGGVVGPIPELIGSDGGSLTENVGPPAVMLSTEVAATIGGSYFKGHDAITPIGHEAAPLVGGDGASLIGGDGASLIGGDGASLIITGKNNIMPTGGASLIGKGGAGAPRERRTPKR